HNLCIDRNVPVPMTRFHDDIRPGDEWRVYDNWRDDDQLLRDRAVSLRRRTITLYIENMGIMRTIHASMNSRCH
ncbi:MAG: hypothetical protein ACK51L_04865, partial [bacterium]